MLIPADVTARLIEAATELMREQDFSPLSERDIEIWLTQNADAVTERARQLQMQMFEKYLKHQSTVDSIISQTVYRRIRKGRE